jgi:hypothetical protein
LRLGKVVEEAGVDEKGLADVDHDQLVLGDKPREQFGCFIPCRKIVFAERFNDGHAGTWLVHVEFGRCGSGEHLSLLVVTVVRF